MEVEVEMMQNLCGKRDQMEKKLKVLDKIT